MSKTVKTLIITFALLIVGLIAACSVFAQSTTYTSSIYMAGNSTLTGSSRQYNQRNHKITLYPTLLNGNTKMYISLSKDGWFGSTSVSSTDAYMTQTNVTYAYEMGNHDTGKYHYYFSTFGGGHYGGEFRANPVNMISYD